MLQENNNVDLFFHCLIANTHINKYLLNKYFWKNDCTGKSEETRALAFEVVREDLIPLGLESSLKD